MITYGDRTWCEYSPAPNAEGVRQERTHCGNEECPRRLTFEEGYLTCKEEVPVAYANFRDGEFCPGFIPVKVDLHA